MNDPEDDMKKIKIGIFISTNIQVGAGVERVAFQMIEDTPKKFKVYLIQTDFFDGIRMTDSEYNYIKEKCEIVTLRGFGFISILRGFGPFTPILVQIVARILRFKNRNLLTLMDKLDIIYLTSNWWVGLFSKESKIFIGSSHTDFGFSESSLTSLVKAKLINSGLIFRRFSAFHTFPGMESMSRYVSNKIIGVFPPRGVDTAKYFPRKLSDEVNILFIARLEECKGPIIAIDAFKDAISKIKNSFNIYLTIAGAGPLSEEVKRRTSENIKFYGAVDASTLRELYGKSDVFLAPTSCDNFPIVVLEGLASGAHAIISSSLKGRFDDFVKNGYAEYANPDTQSFSKTIENCLVNISTVRKKRIELMDFFSMRYKSQVISKNIYDWMKKLADMP